MKGTVEELIPQMLKLDRTKVYELKEKKSIRTLTANSYYWVLVGKLAKVLRTSNEEIHEKLIKRYSHNISYFSTLSSIDITKYGIKYYELENTFKKGDTEFNSYKVFQPSSQMNKEEFCYLIDGIVSECKEVGIETMTPNELAQLKSLMEVA